MKTNTLLSIDSNIKKDFKAETSKNGTDMSSAVEYLMAKYCQSSKKARAERYRKIKEARDGRNKS